MNAARAELGAVTQRDGGIPMCRRNNKLTARRLVQRLAPCNVVATHTVVSLLRYLHSDEPRGRCSISAAHGSGRILDYDPRAAALDVRWQPGRTPHGSANGGWQKFAGTQQGSADGRSVWHLLPAARTSSRSTIDCATTVDAGARHHSCTHTRVCEALVAVAGNHGRAMDVATDPSA